MAHNYFNLTNRDKCPETAKKSMVLEINTRKIELLDKVEK